MTERLYYTDAYLREFSAAVVEAAAAAGRPAVVLDRTAFYPTSGGQPHDLGDLDGARVVDVIDDGARIVHVLDRAIPAGQAVTGRVDWARRFDLMQQHTGQHVLSQAFERVLGAETVSVHIGETCTVELSLERVPADGLAAAEDLANRIVFEDRPVTVRFVDESEVPSLGLRRPPKKSGTLRIVTVAGFDVSACGGTHVARTGEIGPIHARRSERVRGRARVEFLCGWRAVRDHRLKTALVNDLGARFSVGDREIGDAVARLHERLARAEAALDGHRRAALAREAADRLAAAERIGPVRLVRGALAHDAEAARVLARHLLDEPAVVALLLAADGRLIVGRSRDLPLDAAGLLREAGGRGGGSAEFAQGAGDAAVLDRAAEILRRADA